MGSRARSAREKATGCTMPPAWELKMEIPVETPQPREKKEVS